MLRLCAVWVVTVLVFLTISPGDKVIRYLLPALPAAAVLVAAVLYDVPRIGSMLQGLLRLVFSPVAAAVVHLSLSPRRERGAQHEGRSDDLIHVNAHQRRNPCIL